LTQLSCHCPNFRAIALSLASLSKDCRLYRKTQLSSVWPIFRVFAVSIDFNIFRESGLTFERSLSIDCFNFRAESIVRLKQLSSGNYRSIAATFDNAKSIDTSNFRLGHPPPPHEEIAFNTPHEEIAFNTPHEGIFLLTSGARWFKVIPTTDEEKIKCQHEMITVS
jgi:hypothetical protein